MAKNKTKEGTAGSSLGENSDEEINQSEISEQTKIKTKKLSAEEIEQKKKILFEKAAKLKEKLSEEAPKTEELKEQVKGKKKGEMLVPLDEYVKSGIYIGTKVVTPLMRPWVYRRRADGLAIFNTDLIDEKLKEGIEYLSKFNANDIILVCKREAGWKVVEKFGELTGIRV
ncbi:MAG TPA: hypothetical protein VJA20_00235, partial [Candidatus Nanoarchaeia archaeon]|nr:hypothetical protein [Candidatus Nanoarchaeia archaeon]